MVDGIDLPYHQRILDSHRESRQIALIHSKSSSKNLLREGCSPSRILNVPWHILVEADDKIILLVSHILNLMRICRLNKSITDILAAPYARASSPQPLSTNAPHASPIWQRPLTILRYCSLWILPGARIGFLIERSSKMGKLLTITIHTEPREIL